MADVTTAQPVKSTEALVAAVAVPEPDKKGKFTSGLCACCSHICTCCMAMWCCTDAVILGKMKGSCMKIIGYFFFLYVVIIVFSCLGYDYYGRSSNRGMPLATISDIFYCLWVISFVGAIGYIRYVIRHKYDIPPQCCTCDEEGVCDDCCCAFWCGCCTTAQVARHEYAIPATGTVNYSCTTATGEP